MEKLPFLRGGINQVALVVQDLDKTVEQYWTRFGIGPWSFYTYGKPLLKTMTYRGKAAEYRMRIALAKFGLLDIELIEMVQGSSVYADFVSQHGYGVHHFGMQVDDMPTALAAAKEHGIEMMQDGYGFGVEGDGAFAYLDTVDLIGVMLELRQSPRLRHPPEKVYPPEKSETKD